MDCKKAHSVLDSIFHYELNDTRQNIVLGFFKDVFFVKFEHFILVVKLVVETMATVKHPVL